eukprot:Rmarinus@m.6095
MLTYPLVALLLGLVVLRLVVLFGLVRLVANLAALDTLVMIVAAVGVMREVVMYTSLTPVVAAGAMVAASAAGAMVAVAWVLGWRSVVAVAVVALTTAAACWSRVRWTTALRFHLDPACSAHAFPCKAETPLGCKLLLGFRPTFARVVCSILPCCL